MTTLERMGIEIDLLEKQLQTKELELDSKYKEMESEISRRQLI